MLLLTLLISEITQSCLPDLQAPQILHLAKDISKGSAATKDMEIGLNRTETVKYIVELSQKTRCWLQLCANLLQDQPRALTRTVQNRGGSMQ